MGIYDLQQIKKTFLHRGSVYTNDSGDPAIGSGVNLGQKGDIWQYCLVDVVFKDTLSASSRSADLTPLFGNEVAGVYVAGQKKTFTGNERWLVEVNACKDFYLKVDNLGEESVVGEVIGTGDGVTTSFSHTCNLHPVKATTVSISYTIGAVGYTATDDGNGNISGTNCSGTINYETGEINLTFTTAPDNATNITVDYTGISEIDIYLTPFNT